MRLAHESSGEVVLYDDHGVAWMVTLGWSADLGARVIELRGPGAPPVAAAYEGELRDAGELPLGEVVAHSPRAPAAGGTALPFAG